MKQVLFFAVFLYSIHAFAQAHERWDVKTLTDGFTPNLNSARRVTVASIQRIPKIPVRNTQPRLNMERQVITITGTIKKKVKEDDRDYHIELSDGSIQDSTFVCEAVDPEYGSVASSPYADNFQAVRDVVKNLRVGDKVTFTGLMFQDKRHNPSPYRTRNFIEMHPILREKKL